MWPEFCLQRELAIDTFDDPTFAFADLSDHLDSKLLLAADAARLPMDGIKVGGSAPELSCEMG